MSDDEFTKLFTYLQRRFDELEAKIDTKTDADPVYRALDGIARRLDIEAGERDATSADPTAMSAGTTSQPRDSA